MLSDAAFVGSLTQQKSCCIVSSLHPLPTQKARVDSHLVSFARQLWNVTTTQPPPNVSKKKQSAKTGTSRKQHHAATGRPWLKRCVNERSASMGCVITGVFSFCSCRCGHQKSFVWQRLSPHKRKREKEQSKLFFLPFKFLWTRMLSQNVLLIGRQILILCWALRLSLVCVLLAANVGFSGLQHHCRAWPKWTPQLHRSFRNRLRYVDRRDQFPARLHRTFRRLYSIHQKPFSMCQ